MIPDIVRFLLTALAAGGLASVVMEAVLWIVGSAGWAKANMIVALGSLFTRSREAAFRVGLILHAVAGIGFAMLYTLLMMKLGYTDMPHSMVIGAGVGFAHGLIVSLGLVWVVAEQHPLEEFNEAGMAIGLSHILGHVAYGAVVGLVVGISPL
jgi:hypothetical protein